MSETTKKDKKQEELETAKAVLEAETNDLQVLEPAEIKDGQIIFTHKHLELIKNQIAPTATPEEYDLFIMMARRTRLDPLLKQLYFIKYGTQVSYVTSIDSYRIIAHRTGTFVGVDEPIFTYDSKGLLTHCMVTVYKLINNERYAFSAKVKFSEYNTGKNQWQSKPETMIAKVAEAHALRKAFPQDLSGVYTLDEMEQADKQNKVLPAQTEKPVTMISTKQHGEILELLGQKGKTQADLLRFIKAGWKVEKVSNLTARQANTVIMKLSEMPDLEEVPSVDEPDPEYDDSIVTSEESAAIAEDVPF